MNAAKLMDAGQYLVTGALIGAAGTLLAINVGAMYDFMKFVSVCFIFFDMQALRCCCGRARHRARDAKTSDALSCQARQALTSKSCMQAEQKKASAADDKVSGPAA
jgi:hypothetical protein